MYKPFVFDKNTSNHETGLELFQLDKNDRY